MSGRLAVVGLGPGDARWLTREAEAALVTSGSWGAIYDLETRSGFFGPKP